MGGASSWEEPPQGRSLLQGGASSREEPPPGRSLLLGGASSREEPPPGRSATMFAKICILRNFGCANWHFAQPWWSTYVEPPHVEPPYVEAPHVEPPHGSS